MSKRENKRDYMTRRGFLGQASAATALMASTATRAARSAEGLEWKGGQLANDTFRLLLSPQDGLRNTGVIHIPSGSRLAEGDYSYSFARPIFHESRSVEEASGTLTVSMLGTSVAGALEVLHTFRVPRHDAWIEEQITLRNLGTTPLDLHDARCGLVLALPLSQRRVTGNWSEYKITAVPYRREPNGHRSQYVDFDLGRVLTERFSSELWTLETTVTPAYASEGWALTDGKQGFLISKYSEKGMEWSLFDRVPMEGDEAGLRWGGFGIYLGDPEHGAWLLPGESHQFGVTRVTAYSGGILEGFYTFREEMAQRGHGCPPGFNPPVHWNELYDNKLWWLPNGQQDNSEMRKKYYTLADMKDEAAKAKAIGAEALYMDPGWDTNFASKIWDESRLGAYKSFTTMLSQKYGLKSSLHTPLSGWCNPSSYPAEMYRLDRFGRRATWEKERGYLGSPLCGASRQYLEETVRRLKALAQDGAAYFMFDGTMYHSECWDERHGHGVPARREEHVQAMCRLARMVHADYPGVLIEMHDPVVGGNTMRYAPTYYGHGRAPQGEQYAQASGFDSVWAFELMWMPMEDIVSGRAITLYYYNLAYGLPLYIHVDLRTDNRNGLVFWWNASCCRHLGIGGTHQDAAVHEAHQRAMATYRRLSPFYKAGSFYGLDETIHVHADPTRSAAVVNCFNLDVQPMRRVVEFIPGAYGLDPNRRYAITGTPSRPIPMGYALTVTVAALGHQLVEINPA
jgi:hypothetical protein